MDIQSSLHQAFVNWQLSWKQTKQKWITVHLKPAPTACGLLYTLRDTCNELAIYIN